VPASPVVQASQESIEALRSAAGLWGSVFAVQDAEKTQLALHAEAVAEVYQAFGAAFGALPRFRTEPALRRFMEAMQQLERALRKANAPSLGPAIAQAADRAAEGAKQAETAFSTLSGKVIEPAETVRPVRGAVQRLLSDRGYGFVRAEGGTSEVFFSAQAVRGVRFGELRAGQAVTFRIVPDPRVPGRMHAVDVQPLR
jgi:cold shock CspA family protein